MRQAHDLIQGSDQWHQFRLEHFTASEAAAMLGLSSKTTRTELLAAKSLGNAKEFSDWVQKNILDYGHEVEAKARPIVEEMIGDELFPATYSFGKLSASCDGLTMDGEIAMEHKQWNKALAEAVANKQLPDEYQPQCQQIMMVTGAKKVIFVCSDGTIDNFVSMEVFPDPEWQKRISKGWKQFKEDLENYQHVEHAPKPEGKAPDQLPALHIEVQGMVTASNLLEFRRHAMAVFGDIKTELKTDEDFANAEKTVKWCGQVEDRLEAAKQHALGQTQSIDELFRTIDEIKEEARRVRLDLEKSVKTRKDAIRSEIVQQGKDDLAAHINKLNERLGANWMPRIEGNFAGVIKGKRTVASLTDAVGTELANKKIEANDIADRIAINHKELGEHEFLFPDFATVCTKAVDDFSALLAARIAQHEKKQEEERERIRKEEADKAQREAEQKAEAERARIRQEEASKLEQQRLADAEKQAKAIQQSETKANPLKGEPPIDVEPQQAPKQTVVPMKGTNKPAEIEMVTITKDQYNKLLRDAQWLACLETAGVDNWEGIDQARELFTDFEGAAVKTK